MKPLLPKYAELEVRLNDMIEGKSVKPILRAPRSQKYTAGVIHIAAALQEASRRQSIFLCTSKISVTGKKIPLLSCKATARAMHDVIGQFWL